MVSWCRLDILLWTVALTQLYIKPLLTNTRFLSPRTMNGLCHKSWSEKPTVVFCFLSSPGSGSNTQKQHAAEQGLGTVCWALMFWLRWAHSKQNDVPVPLGDLHCWFSKEMKNWSVTQSDELDLHSPLPVFIIFMVRLWISSNGKKL